MNIYFTIHAEERIVKRNLTKEDIIDAIRHPDKTYKKYDRYYFQKRLQRGMIEVSCEKTEKHIKVITIYWI